MVDDLIWFPSFAEVLALRAYNCSWKHYWVGTHLPHHPGGDVVPSNFKLEMLLGLPVANLH